MRRFRRATLLGAVAVIGMASGCESMGGGPRRRPASEVVAGGFEAGASEGEKSRHGGFSPGGWSSKARDIESNMMKSSADPNWDPAR